MSLLIWIYRNILHPSERLFWNFWWSLISETLGSPLIGQLYGSSRFRIPSSTVISYFIFGESDSVEDLWQLHNSILNHDHIFQCLRVRLWAYRGIRQMQNSLLIMITLVNFGQSYCKEDGNFDTKCMIIYLIFGESDSERGWGDFGHVRDGRQAGAIVENGVQNKLPSIWGPASGIYYHQYEHWNNTIPWTERSLA